MDSQINIDKGKIWVYSVLTLNQEEQMETLKLNGIEYKVIGTRPFEVDGKKREHLRLRRLTGEAAYCAIKYENGAISSVVRVGK